MDNWKKLRRLIGYVQAIIQPPFILESDSTGNMVWSIDASFVVQMDMKNHTGYCLTLVKGSPISRSLGEK